jgi:hypothetical protein
MAFSHQDATDANDQQIVVVKGGTDNTTIGNVADALKVSIENVVNDSGEAIVIIPIDEQRIDEGVGFSHAHTHSVGNGAVYYHLLRTPDTTKRIHYTQIIAMTGSGRVEYYENPTITNIGGSANIYNRNRNSATTPTLIVKHSPVVTADGTLLDAFESGTNGSGKGTNGAQFGTIELVLKQNTDYLVKYVSSSSNNIYSEFHFWQEVGP